MTQTREVMIGDMPVQMSNPMPGALAGIMLAIFQEKVPPLIGVVELPEKNTENFFEAKFKDGRIARLTFTNHDDNELKATIDDMTLFEKTGKFNMVFEEVVYNTMGQNDLMKIAEILALQVLAFPRLDNGGK